MRNKAFFIIISLIIFIFVASVSVYAQTPTPTPAASDNSIKSKQLDDLNNKIRELEQKVSDLRSQGKSLSTQISTMDNQIKLTEYRINATKQEIEDVITDISAASKRMKNLEGSLTDVSKVLLNRIATTYKIGGYTNLQMVLGASDVSNVFSRINYMRIVQAHDKQLLYDTKQAQNDYSHQKQIFESKKQKVEGLKAQLEKYTAQLDQEKGAKVSLLNTTQNDEKHYQAQLSQARAQISAFKSFATSQVGSGASILPAQSSPDGWYYNQRDERWGNNNIGASPEKVWEVGCLLSSVAMIMKKHGAGVTPADIAANSSYFFSNTAYMAIPWGGGRFTSAWGSNQAVIDSKLASGEPVIVGVKGGSHFIVLKSGSGGNYIMHDPWNGPDLNFSDYYSSISQYGYYN